MNENGESETVEMLFL